MKQKQPSRWFIFSNNQILLSQKEDGFTVPFGTTPPIQPNGSTVHQFAVLDGLPCYAFHISSIQAECSDYVMVDLRSSYDYLPLPQYNVAGKAYEVLYWDNTTSFCPVCGAQTFLKTASSKQCPECHFEIFPHVSTAILALVRKGDEILLVRAHNFRGTFHSLVAGFLETGETLEECVQREVMEETGLTITNITYFGSQPWPFPSGLMVGFIADYVSGEIKLQEEELSAGAFFSKANLPELPRKLSLARKMIDWWINQ